MTTNGQPGLRWNPRGETLEENPFPRPDDPRYIPEHVWDQLDLDGRLWLISQQEINALDVFHLRTHLSDLSVTAGRLWFVVLLLCATTATALVVIALMRL